jgi:hypothetical protein
MSILLLIQIVSAVALGVIVLRAPELSNETAE